MRFTTASVALFVGLAAAVETVYETQDVTITSCGPEVTNCPARSHSATEAPATSTSGVAPVETSSAPAAGVPSASGPAYSAPAGSAPAGSAPAGSAPAYTPSAGTSGVYPVASSSGAYVPPAASSPSGVAPYPVSPSVSVITVTTCIPTVTYSTITFTPSATPSGVAPTYPAGTGVPGGKPTPGSSSSSPIQPPVPTFTGAASTVGSSFAVGGLAAIAAVFLA